MVLDDETASAPLRILPHPSGLNRLWNERDAAVNARILVLPLLGLGKWA
jgi:hypothetical protein